MISDSSLVDIEWIDDIPYPIRRENSELDSRTLRDTVTPS